MVACLLVSFFLCVFASVFCSSQSPYLAITLFGVVWRCSEEDFCYVRGRAYITLFLQSLEVHLRRGLNLTFFCCDFSCQALKDLCGIILSRCLKQIQGILCFLEVNGPSSFEKKPISSASCRFHPIYDECMQTMEQNTFIKEAI